MNRKRGFSLIELVVVIVIVGVIAIIAIPRMTKGASRAGGAALRQDLALLREAIELYRAEHAGQLPTLASFTSQMTEHSDMADSSFSIKINVAGGIIYGPYLRDIPELPIGLMKGANGVADSHADGIGWIYTEATGQIKANAGATEKDAVGTLLRSF